MQDSQSLDRISKGVNMKRDGCCAESWVTPVQRGHATWRRKSRRRQDRRKTRRMRGPKPPEEIWVGVEGRQLCPIQGMDQATQFFGLSTIDLWI